jgi:TonB-linked SusC/RagA family outer membrane protein
MRLIRLVFAGGLVALLTGALAPPALTQTGTIQGQVTDLATGQPVADASVAIAGTNRVTRTDSEGRYTLSDLPLGSITIRVSLLGYQPQTAAVNVTVGEPAQVNFALNETVVTLDAVVVSAVTGRAQRERELGTNIGRIDMEEINLAPITSVSDVLSGRMEGVILQDVNGTSGTAQRIRIRGANSVSLSNEPLVYIDGILTESSSAMSIGVGGQEASRLNDLNPNDIESVEVVKGPGAAALYGTAAASGVLLITTKRGRAGAPEWNAYVEAGSIKDITEYPTNYMAYEVIGDPNAPFFFPSGGAFDSTNYLACPNRAAAEGSCTQDDVATFNTLMDPRTTPFSRGNRQRYGASVRGGTDRVRYYVSGELEDERGVIDYNTRDKVSVRANLDAAVNDQLDLSVSSGYAQVSNDFENNDNSIFSTLIGGLLGEAYFIPESAKAADDRPGVHRRNYGFFLNQVDKANFVVNDNVDRFMISGKAVYRPLDWLSLNASGGLDLVAGHTFITLQPDLLPIAESFARGLRESDRANTYTYTFNTSAIAAFSLNEDLASTTTVGGSFNQSKTERSECFGSGLVQGTASCGTTSFLFEVDEDFFSIKTAGAYVSTELAWRDRMFVAGAVRGDDNSAFGADLGLVAYPSAQVSWVIGEEAWFPWSTVVSSLQLRAGIGESGLRPNFRDAETLFSPVTVARGGGDEAGITVDRTGNVELKPEKVREIEVGFEAGLFDNRLGLDFAYFDKRSRDALIERRLPGSYGVDDSRFENLGEIKNAGIELGLNLSAIDRPEFGLNVIGRLTTLNSEVVALGEGVEPIIFNRGLQRHQEGREPGAFFQPEIFWNDEDGNGLLTETEVTLGDSAVYIGPSLPTWQTAVGADLRLSNWLSFSTLFEFRGGNFQGNDSEAFRCGFRENRGCSAVGNPDASLEEQARYIADRFLGSAYGYVEKANFGKWREASVTLRAPEAVARSAPALRGLSVTLAGRNLATWTDYSGLDPETVEGGGDADFSQSEFNTQPPVRYLMVRVNYTFR